VAEGFGRANLVKLRAKYKAPDRIGAPVEELRRFVPTYQKVDGARRIGPHLMAERSQSPSFRVFAATVRQLAEIL